MPNLLCPSKFAIICNLCVHKMAFSLMTSMASIERFSNESQTNMTTVFNISKTAFRSLRTL